MLDGRDRVDGMNCSPAGYRGSRVSCGLASPGGQGDEKTGGPEGSPVFID